MPDARRVRSTRPCTDRQSGGTVDPEVQVSEAGPRQRPGAAPARHILSGDLERQAPPLRRARQELAGVREQPVGGLPPTAPQWADAVRRHQVDRLRPQHASTRGVPAREDHPQEARVVEGGCEEAAAAVCDLRFRRHIVLRGVIQPSPLGNDLAGRITPMHRREATVHRPRQRVARIVHPKRAKQVVAEGVAQPLASHRLDNATGPVDAGAVLPPITGVE